MQDTLAFLAQRRFSVRALARLLEWRLIALVLVIKLIVLLFGAMSYQVVSNQRFGGTRSWIAIWDQWDGPHYQDLAEHGYQAEGEMRIFIVFYPLFPWLTRLFAPGSGNYLLSSFVVSGLASIAAGLLLHRLALLDFDASVASQAVWFLFIFPTSYFLHIGYTESLFLALTLAAFLAARTDRWMLAGMLGALASLSRVNGLLLIPALVTEAFLEYRRTRRINWQWLWIGAVAAGFGGYLLLNWYVTGDPLMFLVHQREYWQKSLTWPWVGIWGAIESISWRDPWESQMVGAQETIFIFLGLACTIWCFLRLRPAYGVWMASNWLLITSTAFVLSVPRYTLMMFPIFILFARLSRNQVWFGAITVWSILFMSLFIIQFVQGRWAF